MNAHPHLGGDGVVAVAHNGVIENYAVLKERLEVEGYRFRSATDTEVIAHLIARNLEEDQAGSQATSLEDRHAPLVAAVRKTLLQLRVTYGLVVLFRDFPRCSLPRGSAVRWSSALARVSTTLPATRRHWPAAQTRLSIWQTMNWRS